MKEQANTASDTAREYDKIRKERLKGAAQNAGKIKGEEENQQPSEQSQENSENNQKKLDNDQNSSYIKGEEASEENDQQSSQNEEQQAEESSEENEELSKEERLFREQFKGDPIKAVKAWSNGQSEYMKLRNETKEYKQALEGIDKIMESNPEVEEAFNKALNSNNQSFSQAEDKESVSDKPVNTSQKSKLNIDKKLFNVNEQELSESGYIDQSQKDIVSDSQWQNQVRQAKLQYLEDNLPDMIAQQAAEKTQQRIEEFEQQKREKAQQQKNRELIKERYDGGIETVVNKYGLDFAGNTEHADLLDEIEELVVNIRDPKNRNVIHPNAVEIATQQVMAQKGINPQSSNDGVEEAKQEAKQKADNMYNKNSFNANKKNNDKSSNKPQNVAEQLSQRRYQDYEETMKKRKQTGRINKNN